MTAGIRSHAHIRTPRPTEATADYWATLFVPQPIHTSSDPFVSGARRAELAAAALFHVRQGPQQHVPRDRAEVPERAGLGLWRVRRIPRRGAHPSQLVADAIAKVADIWGLKPDARLRSTTAAISRIFFEFLRDPVIIFFTGSAKLAPVTTRAHRSHFRSWPRRPHGRPRGGAARGRTSATSMPPTMRSFRMARMTRTSSLMRVVPLMGELIKAHEPDSRGGRLQHGLDAGDGAAARRLQPYPSSAPCRRSAGLRAVAHRMRLGARHQRAR